MAKKKKKTKEDRLKALETEKGTAANEGQEPIDAVAAGENGEVVAEPVDRHAPLIQLVNPETEELIARIEYDGKVRIGKDVAIDEVARQFWTALSQHFDSAILARLESESIARARRRVQIGDAVARCALRLMNATPDDPIDGIQAAQENLRNAVMVWQQTQ